MKKAELIKKLENLKIDFDKRLSEDNLLELYLKVLEDTAKSFNSLVKQSPKKSKAEIYKEMSELVRVRIQCKDPSMGNVDADSIIVFNNSATVKAVFPTNTESFYIPKATIQAIENLEFSIVKKLKKPRQVGDMSVRHETTLLKKYSIEILKHIDIKELQKIQKIVQINKD
jgi:hypothetical protein